MTTNKYGLMFLYVDFFKLYSLSNKLVFNFSDLGKLSNLSDRYCHLICDMLFKVKLPEAQYLHEFVKSLTKLFKL